mmetsp:Transcript_27476/g.67534  ORF Transcript_27476/g.67534 Transcript_27476/m.67534 type:complete len:206 (-) Transcript_27476:379-996(-)
MELVPGRQMGILLPTCRSAVTGRRSQEMDALVDENTLEDTNTSGRPSSLMSEIISSSALRMRRAARFMSGPNREYSCRSRAPTHMHTRLPIDIPMAHGCARSLKNTEMSSADATARTGSSVWTLPGSPKATWTVNPCSSHRACSRLPPYDAMMRCTARALDDIHSAFTRPGRDPAPADPGPVPDPDPGPEPDPEPDPVPSRDGND